MEVPIFPFRNGNSQMVYTTLKCEDSPTTATVMMVSIRGSKVTGICCSFVV